MTLVAGPTGTGKSLVCLQFLTAGGPGERGLLIALEESADQLLRTARSCGLELAGQVADGTVRIISQYPEVGSVQDLLLQIERAVVEHRPTGSSWTASRRWSGSAARRAAHTRS